MEAVAFSLRGLEIEGFDSELGKDQGRFLKLTRLSSRAKACLKTFTISLLHVSGRVRGNKTPTEETVSLR